VERFAYIRKDEVHMIVEWWIARPGGILALGDTLDCRRV
jgi:hypothetical protein